MSNLQTHLCRYVLDKGQIEPLVTLLPDGRPKISAEYDPPDGSYRRSVTIVFDPAQDYLPVDVVSRYVWCNTLDQEFTVTKTEIVSGVRIPTAGRGAVYYINVIYPDGLTNGEVNAMDKQYVLEKIEPRVKRESVLLGQPAVVEFDASKILVNDIQPSSFFQLEIPDGYDVADFSKSRIAPDPPKKTSKNMKLEQPIPLSRSTGLGSSTWIAFAGCNALAILFIFGRRMIRSRFANVDNATLPQINGDSH